MAGKADFTEEEWETMRKGVAGSALLVSLADRGFFDTFKEAGALAGHLKEAREKSSSQLVREVAEMRGTGFGLTDSPQEVETATLDALRSSVATLKSKAPDEVAAYSELVLAVAGSVAKAGGDNVEAAESGALEKIKGALQPG
jgi:hypothetical protein